ncbi:MAG: hypothetical protein H6744_21815 [Deltaproteobacteria bacterium]|nr:hypothetical protein [Deltaproteobacteria bacterium]
MPSHAPRIARWFALAAALCLGAASCDGGGDAGGAVSPQAMVSACEDACDARHAGCPTTDLALCDFGCKALANLRSDCRESLFALSECEAQASWQCLDTSEFVAVPVDPSSCSAEAASFESLCPAGG